MPRQEVIELVDNLVKQGRVQPAMRDMYIQDIENGLGEHLLRGADYTNKTKELAEQRRQAQAQIEQDKQAVQLERQKLQTWYQQAQQELDRANQIQRELPDLTAKMAAYEQTLKDYNMMGYVNLPEQRPAATTGGYTPTTPPAYPSATPTPPANKFLTQDDAAQALQNLFSTQGKVLTVMARHQQLFGTPLTDDLMSHYLSTGEDPEAHWRVKYAVETKEAELANRAREAEVARIREEERAKLMSEYALDPSRMGGGMPPTGQGLPPVLAQFAQSRATAHAVEAKGEEPLKPLLPEQKPELQAARDRIQASVELFNKNFDLNGLPTSEEGKRLYNKHFVSDQY